ncbi:MAG: DUF4292 domain-containing protein [Bacteroidia bacterium]|nr:DUF4292 domain-containing protein [Bacteroidia bacterium]
MSKRMEGWKDGKLGGTLTQSSNLPSFQPTGLRFFGLLFLLFIGVNFISCKGKKKLQKTDTPIVKNNDTTLVLPDSTTEYVKCKMDYKNGKALKRLMEDKELDYKTVVAKFSCEMNMDNDDNSFSVAVRSRKDSVIWLNISKGPVDALRMLITKDSVKFMITTELGGLDKGYFKGDFNFINEKLHADLDFDVIQALLFGNSAEFLNDTVKMKGGKDKNNCQYFLSTIRKRRLQKLMDGTPPKESVQTMWLNPETFKIVMLEFDDAETKRKFNACYDDFQPVDNFLAPFKLLYTISTPEKIIKADIKYSRIKLNEDGTTFPYKVPASYKEIEIKPKNPEDH